MKPVIVDTTPAPPDPSPARRRDWNEAPALNELLISEILVGEGRRALRDLAGLADSIRESGLLNPITVTTDRRLVAGYHRLEACKLLGWTAIPVNVLNLSDLRATLAGLQNDLDVPFTTWCLEYAVVAAAEGADEPYIHTGTARVLRDCPDPKGWWIVVKPDGSVCRRCGHQPPAHALRRQAGPVHRRAGPVRRTGHVRRPTGAL